MNEEQLFEKIEAYLKGALSPENAADFVREIEADPKLARLVDIHRLEYEAMERMREKDFGAQVQKWMEELEAGGPEPGQLLPQAQSSPPSAAPSSRRWWWFLLALAGIAFLAYWLWPVRKPEKQKVPPALETPRQEPPEEQPKDTKEPVAKQDEPKSETPIDKQAPRQPEQSALLALSDTYFDDPYFEAGTKSISNSRGNQQSGDIPVDSLLSRAILAYTSGQFAQAGQIAAQVPDANPDYGDARLLIGRALYRQKRYAQAALVFQNIQTDQTITPQEPELQQLIRQTAEWNEAIARIAQGSSGRVAALALLRRMEAETGHLFQEKAAELRKQLDQLPQ